MIDKADSGRMEGAGGWGLDRGKKECGGGGGGDAKSMQVKLGGGEKKCF